MTLQMVTLLTDFGLHDTYVGQMKGVMLARNPGLTFVDLTHLIPPQSVLAGALHLRASWNVFPPGTVHLVVVDPDVGSDRRAIALTHFGHHFVGPDNGVLDGVLGGERPALAVQLDPSRFHVTHQSRTFHGRDVFAPAAATIASGASPGDLGTIIEPESLSRVVVPEPEICRDVIRGTVLLIDHYGNAITNVSSTVIARHTVRRVQCGRFHVAELVGIIRV